MFGFVVGGGGATEGSVNHIGNFAASDTVDLTLRQDPNRWVVVIEAEFSGDEFQSALSAPTIDGTAMTEAVNTNSGYSDDGHRAGIWYARVPSGDSFSYSGGSGGLRSIFEVLGVVDLGGSLNINSRTGTNICTSKGKGTVTSLPGFSIGVIVRNFGYYDYTSDVSNATIVGGNTYGMAETTYLDSSMDSLTVSYEGNNPTYGCDDSGGAKGAFVIEHTLSCSYDLEIL